jgi:methionine--tRNA ligase beta chain
MVKETITYSDFARLDVRVGRVLTARSPDWSDKLLAFEVDFGAELGTRTIFAGIKKYYAPELFVGRLYAFVVNLEDKKVGSEVSQGMMLMVDDPAKPMPIELSSSAVEGSVVR